MDMERLNNANASLFDIITSGDGVVGDDDHFTAEIRQLNEAEEQLIDRLHIFEERKFNSSNIVVNDRLSFRDDDIIEINAGGKIIAARRGTLCQLSGTRLETLFSGRWDDKLSRDDNGRIFLDVNPDIFQAIVDYLNEMMISSEDDPSEPPVPPNDEDRQVLAQYLELFLLRVPPPQMPDSNIITQYSQVKLLHKWLEEAEEEKEEGDVELSLIYHSSKENLSNENFHRACDGQGRTLLVIETIEGHIVGGYTNSDWASSEDPMSSVGCWSKANKSFLFALSGFDLSSPCKMDLRNKNVKHAIYNCSQYGAAFGGGCQQCDMKVTGSSVFLNTGQVYECGKSDKLSHGHSYMIQEMEVFRVSDVHHHTNQHHHHRHHQRQGSPKSRVKQFTREVNKAINEKWEALRELEAELCSSEDNFDDEERFINTIASFEKKDIITLNVSGTIMTTTRATLLVTDDSVLARQFDDTKWTEQGGCTLIEHSPYCFGKILDYLRLKRFYDQDFIDEPPLPIVHHNQRNRFHKVCRYYFPGESSKFILGLNR